MTIDILFFSENELVARVNMCFSSLDCNILNELMEEERKRWVLRLDDDHDLNNFTNKKFIRKIWHACILHGYVDECLDALGRFLYKTEID